jgi:formiminotetrahydrofolate cyclodeaminase
VRGAYFNVRINLEGITDQAFRDEALAEAELLLAQSEALEREVLERVEGRFTD